MCAYLLISWVVSKWTKLSLNSVLPIWELLKSWWISITWSQSTTCQPSIYGNCSDLAEGRLWNCCLHKWTKKNSPCRESSYLDDIALYKFTLILLYIDIYLSLVLSGTYLCEELKKKRRFRRRDYMIFSLSSSVSTREL